MPWKLWVGIGLWLGTLAVVPALAAAVLGVHAVLVVLVLGAQIRAARERPAAPVSRVPARLPFVSVHVPTCNEPPALVRRTLAALAALDYPHYEVIVLDNNTASRALWEPVREACAVLGPRFRFVHEDRLDGAKAGALTRCLALADARTEWILTVDADYVVEPDLLRRALPVMSVPSVGAVQLPQAYANTAGAPGLAAAYRFFFDALMPFAARRGGMLLTGTLSLIRRRALDFAGGWSADTITEDADLGVRLAAAGWRGAYLDARLGRGVMPTTLPDLRKQRARWACGNAQVLRSALGRRSLPRRVRAAMLVQLCTWSCGLVLPALTLAACAAAGWTAGAHAAVLGIGAATIALTLGLKVAAFAAAAPRAGRPWRSAWRPLAVHLALAWDGATAWARGLWGGCPPFLRTSKFAAHASWQGSGAAIAFAAVLVAAGVRLAAGGAVGAGAVAIATGLAVVGSVAVLVRELRAAGQAADALHAPPSVRLAS